ncbi:MAG: hypothetical protein ACYTG2_01000 [Planctomycetota bacterium]|jgi:hypothetical protein
MSGTVRVGLAGLLLVATIAATKLNAPPTVRPYIALAHAGQVLPPHQPLVDGLSAFFLFDESSGELTFTLSAGDPQLLFVIRGPAVPGQSGPDVAAGQWMPGPITVGPLSGAQRHALERGRLYIQVFRPSAFPELQDARRGQLLPVANVRYGS